MQASPYDLEELGYPPIFIETPDGKLEYQKRQKEIVQQADPIRNELLNICDYLLGK